MCGISSCLQPPDNAICQVFIPKITDCSPPSLLMHKLFSLPAHWGGVNHLLSVTLSLMLLIISVSLSVTLLLIVLSIKLGFPLLNFLGNLWLVSLRLRSTLLCLHICMKICCFFTVCCGLCFSSLSCVALQEHV